MNLYRIILVLALALPAWRAAAQGTPELLPRQLLQLLPEQLDGYNKRKETKSGHIKIGDITYSLAEKTFNQKKRSVKVLLFDFKSAPVMFDQAVKPWRNASDVLTDTIRQQRFVWEGFQGWESENPHSNTAQIFVAVNNRFIMSIMGEKAALSDIREVLHGVDVSKFPL
jgi:hypothetical protein